MKFLRYNDYLLQNDDIPHNLQGAASEPYHRTHRRVLNRTLSSWEAIAIIFCAVMNTAVLSSTTHALNIAGNGATVAFGLTALLVGCIMAALSKLVNMFPVANAMTEYVYHFVDYDLALLIGLLHWLACSISFAIMIINASNMLLYSFEISQSARLCIALAAVVYSIMNNVLPVRLLGRIAIASAAFKASLFTAIIVILAYGTTKSSKANSENGFGSDSKETHSNGEAITSALTLAVFPFIGMESLAITAAETFKPASSTRKLPYVLGIVTLVLLWTSVTSNLTIDRTDPTIADYQLQGLGAIITYPYRQNGAEKTNLSIPVAILRQLRLSTQYIEVCFAISTFMSASATLYLASRALFGISLHICRHKSILGYLAKLLGFTRVSWKNRVPLTAVFASVMSFMWVIIPATAQPASHGTASVVNILAGVVVISTLLIWASQCTAYLKYWYYHKKYQPFLRDRNISPIPYEKQKRGRMQVFLPIVACTGLLGCLAQIGILLFTTLLIDSSKQELTSSIGVYAVLCLLILIWILMKAHRVLVAIKLPRSKTMAEKDRGISGCKMICDSVFPDRMDQGRFEEIVCKLKNRIYPADFPLEQQVTQTICTQRGIPAPEIRVPDQARSTLRTVRHEFLSSDDPDVVIVPMTINTLHAERNDYIHIELSHDQERRSQARIQRSSKAYSRS